MPCGLRRPCAIGLPEAWNAGVGGPQTATTILGLSTVRHLNEFPPTELAKEAPQIAHHIAATRKAWGLDKVERRELSGAQELTARDLAANRATLDNVRLWDRGPLLRTFGQLQSIRTYYEFVAVDDDRYQVNGALRHVLLSARELDASNRVSTMNE